MNNNIACIKCDTISFYLIIVSSTTRVLKKIPRQSQINLQKLTADSVKLSATVLNRSRVRYHTHFHIEFVWWESLFKVHSKLPYDHMTRSQLICFEVYHFQTVLFNLGREFFFIGGNLLDVNCVVQVDNIS